MTQQVRFVDSPSATEMSQSSATTVRFFYENAGLGNLPGGVTTLGTVFISGQLPAGQMLSAQIQGSTVPVQVDVKTTHPDGSAKMVVLTLPRPDLPPGASLAVDLVASPAPPQPALDLRAGIAAHDFTVAIESAGRPPLQVDVLAALDAALADGTASFWQQGPLATQARVEIPLDGTQRLVFDVTVFQGGGLKVDAQFNNDRAMETQGGRIAYDVTVRMNGEVVADHSLDQALFQNWHESFSSNGRDGGQGLGKPAEGWLNIRQDISRFHEAGAVANYSLEAGVSEVLLQKWFNATQSPSWDAPLSNNGVVKDMYASGGREDIGFTTASNTAWLMTQDARAAAYALGQAEAASAAPWHMWDAASDTWLSTNAYPRLWSDPRGTMGTPGDPNSGGLTLRSDRGGWSLDVAHQPDLSFVPYLMTGERWMLDNLQAQASWSIMVHSPAVRGGDADLVVPNNQVRGAAWSLRQVDVAAWASPDGSVEQAWFQEASDANWKWLVEQIPAWTALQGEAHGYVMGVYGGGALPSWQQDFFASTVIAAAERGNADAMTFLEWQSNFLIGRFQQGDQGFNPRDGASYRIAIADAVTGKPFQTWAEIGANTQERGWSNGDGWAYSQGYYGQLALATLAGIAKLTGSAEAAETYWKLLADSPPFTSDATFFRDPTFWIAPPTLGAPTPPEVPIVPGPVVPPPVVPPPVVVPPVVQEPVTPDPDAPPPPMRALSIILSGDAWAGLPEALVKVDGVEVFRGFIASPRNEGAVYHLGDIPMHETSIVTVRFMKDARGDAPGQDRNLYVRDILLDGVSTGQRANLYSEGERAFTLAGLPAPPPVTPPPVVPPPVVVPPVVQEPVTPDPDAPPPPMRALSIILSGDAWAGLPEALVKVDGVEVFRGFIASPRNEGAVYHLGDIPMHETSIVTVRFMKDARGDAPGQDRNLYVRDILLDGVSTGQRANLYSEGERAFTLAGLPREEVGPTLSPLAPSGAAGGLGQANDALISFGNMPSAEPPLAPQTDVVDDLVPASVVLGQGEDVLRLGLSGDAWLGKAKYVVLVDGEQWGKVNRVFAAKRNDETEFLEVRGDFDPGNHEIAVRFINDAEGERPRHNRNIYVESVAFNGEDLGMSATLLTNGDAVFYF